MDLLASFGQTLSTIFTIIGWGVGGIFAILYFTAQGQRERRKESDDLADGLIKRLQQTVDDQVNQLIQMRTDMEKHTKDRDEQIRKLSDDLKHMQGRNSVLEELFKGRDPAMVEFFKNAPQLIETSLESNVLAKANSEATTHLTETLANFINTLQPILIHAEIGKVK